MNQNSDFFEQQDQLPTTKNPKSGTTWAHPKNISGRITALGKWKYSSFKEKIRREALIKSLDEVAHLLGRR
jgi:hypothetical protein